MLLEDELVDIWSQCPMLYDVRSGEFKNRDAREKALEEIAERLGQTGIVRTFSFYGDDR